MLSSQNVRLLVLLENIQIPFSVVGGPANASARIGDRNYIFYYSDNNEAITYLVGTGFNYQQYEEIPVKVGADPVRGSRGSPIAAAVIESGSPPAASVSGDFQLLSFIIYIFDVDSLFESLSFFLTTLI